MAKVITLSQKFLKDHPRSGEPTFFVEKVLNSLGIDYRSNEYVELLVELNWDKNISKGELTMFWHNLYPNIQTSKYHTIRNGHRFKQGDMVSIRVWSGKPYRSPQIIIAPEQEVNETHTFDIRKNDLFGYAPFLKNQLISPEKLFTVANNDGLSITDFQSWFKWGKQEFYGQVICWVDPKY